MASGRPAFERPSGPIGNQVVVALVHVGGINGFERV